MKVCCTAWNAYRHEYDKRNEQQQVSQRNIVQLSNNMTERVALNIRNALFAIENAFAEIAYIAGIVLLYPIL